MSSRPANVGARGGYALGAVVIWGISPILLKALATSTSPAFTLKAMFAISALLLAPWALPSLRRCKPRELLGLLVCGFLVAASFNVFVAYAAHGVTGMTLAGIVATEPVLILLIAAAVLRQRLQARVLVGTALSLAGVGLLLQGQATAGAQAQAWSSVALVALGAGLWSLGVVLVNALPRLASELETSVRLIFLGSAPFLLLLNAQDFAQAVQLPLPGLLSLGFLALLTTVAANLLWCMSIQNLGAVKTGAFINLIPIVSALSAAAILGEALTWLSLGSLLLVIGGVYVSSRSKL